MPSREPSTTCPSPLHFTGSLTCRLGRGRKTNLLPDPGYNVAFFHQHLPRTRRRVLSRYQEKPPSWTLTLQKSKMSKTSHQKMSSPKSPAAMFNSCQIDINTKKRLILLCSESEFSGVQCATLEVA